MKISEANFVFTTKIMMKDVSDDPTLENEYIIIREPNANEFTRFSDDSLQNMTTLQKILPRCIVESSFENETGTGPATGEEIAKFLNNSSSCVQAVISLWVKACPFAHRSETVEN